MLKRLEAMYTTLMETPFDAARANKALKEVLEKIVIDPEQGNMSLHWRHGGTTDIPVFTRQAAAAF